jgi:hypothetical protein
MSFSPKTEFCFDHILGKKLELEYEFDTIV